MIKVIAMYSIPDGADPEALWKYHTQVHAADIKKLYGNKLKKYIINRVKTVMAGEPKVFAIMESWIESREALAEIDKRYVVTTTPDGTTLKDDFNSRTTNRFRAIVEETEIPL